MIDNEKGQALPLALLILVLGTLLITPFLGHASSSLVGSRIYGETMARQYSAGAGVEHAIWHLQSGTTVVSEGEVVELPEFTINNRTVNVTVEGEGGQVYKITSIATSGDGSSATIQSDVSVGDISVVEGDITLENNVEIEGDVYASGNITLNNNAGITGYVCGGGNLTLYNNAVIVGDVSAGGNLTLIQNAEIHGNARAEGDIMLEEDATITGIVYTTGNIELGNNASIMNDVYIVGNIENIILGENAEIEGNIYITGNITDRLELGNNASITNNVYATGTINMIVGEEYILGNVYENYTGEYPPPPEFPELPVAFGVVIQTWEITY
jgi:predicted acyltransferase (DUF342 family)